MRKIIMAVLIMLSFMVIGNWGITAEKSEIEALIKQLGADEWETREKAQEKLSGIGEPAIPFLKKALESKDIEVVTRAQNILKDLNFIPDKELKKLQGNLFNAILASKSKDELEDKIMDIISPFAEKYGPKTTNTYRSDDGEIVVIIGANGKKGEKGKDVEIEDNSAKLVVAIGGKGADSSEKTSGGGSATAKSAKGIVIAIGGSGGCGIPDVKPNSYSMVGGAPGGKSTANSDFGDFAFGGEGGKGATIKTAGGGIMKGGDAGKGESSGVKNLENAKKFIKELNTPSTAEKSLMRELSERNIAKLDSASWVKDSFKVSPNNKQMTYWTKSGTKWFVVGAGTEDKKYDNIGKDTPIFSPDSKRVAYAANVDDNKWFVVVDGKEEKKFDNIIEGTPIFSPDSKRVAYAAQEGDKWFVVVDGKEEKKYDGIGRGTIVFSPDSKRLAYVAMADNKLFVVVNGKEGQKYDSIMVGSPVFGPDSKRVAYAAKEGDKWFAVIDGKEEKQYDGLDDAPIFSPDSKRVFYIAQSGDKWCAVVDGKEGKKYDSFQERNFTFSPNSKRLAYTVKLGDKWFVVVDGKEGRKYDDTGIGSLIFSPDSSHIAYGARMENKWFMVVDETEKERYDGLKADTFAFSPNSKRLAYGANVGNKWFVVVDGKEGRKYDDILSNPPTFSHDSKRLAYGAMVNDKYFVVVDEEKGEKKYDGIITIGGGRIIFDSPNSFHYLTLKDSNIYLVEEKIK